MSPLIIILSSSNHTYQYLNCKRYTRSIVEVKLENSKLPRHIEPKVAEIPLILAVVMLLVIVEIVSPSSRKMDYNLILR